MQKWHGIPVAKTQDWLNGLTYHLPEWHRTLDPVWGEPGNSHIECTHPRRPFCVLVFLRGPKFITHSCQVCEKRGGGLVYVRVQDMRTADEMYEKDICSADCMIRDFPMLRDDVWKRIRHLME